LNIDACEEEPPMNLGSSQNVWSIFWSAVAVVIFAELGCLARTSALAARYGQPWVIFAGTMVGTAVTMGIGIYAGQAIHHLIPESTARWLTGLFFVLFGALVLCGRVHG
jgi:putative Ca2+/H+ antiporter (TMEM165/GDT1 family)